MDPLGLFAAIWPQLAPEIRAAVAHRFGLDLETGRLDLAAEVLPVETVASMTRQPTSSVLWAINTACGYVFDAERSRLKGHATLAAPGGASGAIGQ